ncbi:FAD binding domain-containing protein [Mycolicibacterium sediminis]|uniref:FAD-binding molybdopterin dehydrogenase n=1 Tax=Mycolicibacterium sediminis TaxID=1286180 RepID=A0A7I7QJC4_9MYCO|nr:FAD binding domain-containing protein [Mycolicibacterium sediminis]BBY26230.1 FAD-binding molybdopterin dehydrogenase [Mycolicibacterium sediminis]
MDLHTVEALRSPTTRAELWPLDAGDAILSGGTWLFSEPQPGLRRLIDVTALGWPPITLSDSGIELAATCTVAQVSGLSAGLAASHPRWTAAPLLHQCCTALVASPKIWRTATVGGNVCLSFPAGSMISLLSALDGTVTVWRPDGTEYVVPVTDFVTGASANVLAVGDVVRSVHLPAAALTAGTAYRKLAPSPLGRSGIVVIGRRDIDGGLVLAVTAATVRPYVFRHPSVPTSDELAAWHAGIPEGQWTDDAHGDPDWRRAVTLVLAEQIRAELS